MLLFLNKQEEWFVVTLTDIEMCAGAKKKKKMIFFKQTNDNTYYKSLYTRDDNEKQTTTWIKWKNKTEIRFLVP